MGIRRFFFKNKRTPRTLFKFNDNSMNERLIRNEIETRIHFPTVILLFYGLETNNNLKKVIAFDSI